MIDADQIEKCIAIAVEAHAGQRRRCGEPAIAHAIRVMAAVGDSPLDMCVAVLHDVVEDTDVTSTRLRERGVHDAIVMGVEVITRDDGETYADYIKRVGGRGWTACRVKIADLRDNLRNDNCGTLRSRYEIALGRLQEQPNDQ